MAYTYDQIFAADPSNPERVASNGVITIFAPGDETKTPLEIRTVDGMSLQNPVQVNESGHGPAFMHEVLDRVAWEGGGFSGFLTSYEGIKEEAVAARESAQEAAAAAATSADNSSAPTAQAVEREIITEGTRANAAVGRVALEAATEASVKKLDKLEAANTFAVKPDNGGKPVGKGEIVVNVRDFGARGDGVANDYAAIQAAFNSARSSKVTVNFPYGIYNVGQKLSIYSNMTIDLCGSTLRRVFNDGPGGKSLLQWDEPADGLHFRNGILDGNGGNYPGDPAAPGFNIMGGSDAILNSTFDNLTFRDVVGTHALDLKRINQVEVRNCRFIGYKDPGGHEYNEAIQLDPDIAAGGRVNRGLLVTGCYFGPSDTPGFGPYPTGVGNHASYPGSGDNDIKIIGNTFDGCSYAGVRPFKWFDTTVANNIFKNCGRGVHVNAASAANIVPESGSGFTVTGNTFTNCDQAVLFVRPIFGPGDSWSKHQAVNITGNNFVRGREGINLYFVSEATITGNRFRDTSQTAITVGYSDSMTISGNTATNIGTNFVWITESGVTNSLLNAGLTAGVTVTGNTCVNILWRGVYVNCKALNATVTNNLFSGVSTASPGRQAIAVDNGADGGTISGNTIVDIGSPNKPTHGINITPNASNYMLGHNTSYGTGNTVLNGSPSTLVVNAVIKGTPEGYLVAKQGSTVMRSDGGIGTTLYVKESGTGSAGWVAK